MMGVELMKLLINFLLCVLLLGNVVFASEFDQPLSSSDKALFQEMLQPAFKLITLLQYLSTVFAVLYLLYAGITFITAGDDNSKKESSKSMIGLTIIGLFVIWGAPYFVNYLLG